MSDVLATAHATEIAAGFGLGTDAVLAGPVDRGWLGQVWQLTSSAGAFAVKESFDELPAERAEEIARFQRQACGNGVNAPRIVPALDGSTAADIHGELVRVYGWVDLAPVDRHLDPAELGQLLATLHMVDAPTDEPIDPWFTDPVGRGGWDVLVADLRYAKAPFAEQLAGLREEILAAEALLASPGEPIQTCHRDLFADNVRATTNGLCVIDWDNSGPESPTQELAIALVEFGHTPDRVRAFVDAYEDAGGPGRVRRLEDFSMAIATLGHIGEFVCREWLSAKPGPEREFATGRVEEFVSEPVTRSLVQDLLDAIQ
jgi:Ser/Thr protein kinase RdoA (MazF antagonist)